MVVAAVFARGGSKGVPRKNVRLLGGVPLIGRAIQVAAQLSEVSRIVVSTDDAEIAEVARRFGAEVPFLRPAELATDTAPEWKAWQHLIQQIGGGFGESPDDVLLSVPSTAPLRGVDDVQACLRRLRRGDADVAVTITPVSHHPAFNMVTREHDGAIQLAMTLPSPVTRRQDAPPMFAIVPLAYAARAPYVLRSSGLFEGRTVAVEVPQERAVDIDTELDWAIAECLWARQASQGAQ